MPLRQAAFLLSFLLALLVLLTACGGDSSTALTPETTATPTSAPPRLLTVCLGQEPASLFPLDNPSSAARSVLSAIYDGPIDTNSYGYQAVILERLPDLANGDAQLFQTSVYVGDEVVDAGGLPVTLAPGVKVRPAGCRSSDCVVEYDGGGEVKMDQMQVTFRLLPGLTWADGEPLTAGDSVYAYNLVAGSPASGSDYLVERTKSYEAADDQTVHWWGKPGFVDPTYFTNFWTPFPQHVWGQIPADQLADSDEAGRAPLGWGPYVVLEWVDGSHISLVKNPRYFRFGEGLPHFDLLTFRFVPDPDTALSSLLAGTCDILDPSLRLDGQVGLLRSMDEQGQIRALFTTTPLMEQLALGIRPATYDNGYNPGLDRPDFFGDARVRQALAMCLDRQQVVNSVLLGLSSVPVSYVPAEHPLYNPAAPAYTFDVGAASVLLEQAGWRDVDNDPATPRRAWGVTGVPNDTPFEVRYVTTDAAQRQQVSAILGSSLAQCGIKANVEFLDQTVLYAPGPDGPLFGRRFDLAEFAMGSAGFVPPCEWFSSPEVPAAANRWVGTNVSGYGSQEYDEACQAARQSLPDEAAHAEAYGRAQSLFAADLPVIPLYWRVRVAAARPEVCNFSLDPTAAGALWNVENFDSGDGCQP